MSASVQNLEEAAGIASEYIYSVDNLPNEVAHLLKEIKIKETRAQELQQEIDKDSARYIRHSLRATSSTAAPSPSTPGPSAKSSLLPAKISASYAEISQLSSEKILLSQRIVDLITRTRARLDADLAKVRILSGEVVEHHAAASPGDGYVMTGRNPALQISESLRNALTGPSVGDLRQTPSTPLASVVSVGPSATKKRRLATSTSIKLLPVVTPTKRRSASPSTIAISASHGHQRSRLSRQIHPMEQAEEEPEAEEDGEGEEGDGDDERLYCFCQKQSYGDMIACDNEGGCPYEWFHLTCVGMKQPTPEKWYCSVCSKNKGVASTTSRKGRKK